jgi:hypothetical protein
MSMEWITHQNKKILYIRYADLSLPDQLAQIDQATQALVDSGSRENLTLTDVIGMIVKEEFIEHSKAKGKISAQYTKKAAIVGIEGVRKILLAAVNAVSGNARVPFPTVEEAKDWLVK